MCFSFLCFQFSVFNVLFVVFWKCIREDEKIKNNAHIEGFTGAYHQKLVELKTCAKLDDNPAYLICLFLAFYTIA